MQELLSARHSVRKFTADPVSDETLKTLVEAALSAATAKNAQNAIFVAVKNKELLDKAAAALAEKNARLAESFTDEDKKAKWQKFLRFGSFFKDAPACFFVYGCFADNTGVKELKQAGAAEEAAEVDWTNPSMQSVGCMVENLCLEAAAQGLGTCYMTSPNYAGREISQAIGFEKEGYTLCAVVPVGTPEGEIKFPPRKAAEEALVIL